MTRTVVSTQQAAESAAVESVAAAVTVEVRAFAAARAALGWARRAESVTAGSTVADVVGRLGAQAPDAAAVLARCAVLIDGRRVSDPAGTAVPEGARLDLLPPFAGG